MMCDVVLDVVVLGDIVVCSRGRVSSRARHK